MRQISTALTELDRRRDLRLHRRAPLALTQCHEPLPRHARPHPGRGHRCTRADRIQRRRHTRATPTRSFARPPTGRPPARDPQLLSGRLRRGQQHNLRAPPRPRLVTLRLVRDQSRGFQIVKPPLHGAPVCTHKLRALARIARHRSPAHHRRHPNHELCDRRRVPAGPLRVPQPEQVALERVRPRLQSVIARRRAAAPAPRPAQQRAHHQSPGLRRQRRDRRPIPTTRRPGRASNRCAIQRHRQRPQASRQRKALRPRTDARGTAEEPWSCDRDAKRARRNDPSRRGWRSVRSTAMVRSQFICGRSPRTGWR
jgi:hypothetical protein